MVTLLRSRPLHALGLACAILAARACPSRAETATAESITANIVNGRVTDDHPAVGALLILAGSEPGAGLSGLCSGTLIGCRTFLTAAHCVCPVGARTAAACRNAGLIDPRRLRIFLQHGGVYAAAHVAISPAYRFASGGDVAVIQLVETTTGVIPDAINQSARLSPGTTGAIVGFGTTLAGRAASNDAGIKREGAVTVGTCPADIPASAHVCWSYVGEGSNVCEGDSGGPLFATVDDAAVVAGITSGGTSADCLEPDRPFDTDVFVQRQWILAAAGDDRGTERCGGTGESAAPTAVFTTNGRLDGAGAEAVVQFDVPDGARRLRIALNGQIASGSGDGARVNRFALFARAGEAPTATAFDCIDANATSFAFCEIEAPMPGTWYAAVRSRQGTGQYQITASSFAESDDIACAGDCSGNRTVTVNEVLLGVNISLGASALSACPSLDTNGDGLVGIDEMIAAVGAALGGCG